MTTESLENVGMPLECVAPHVESAASRNACPIIPASGGKFRDPMGCRAISRHEGIAIVGSQCA